MNKSQVDGLGERLRGGTLEERDLRELSEYRQTFALAYHAVLESIREGLGLVPTGRPSKSTTAIIEKLRRESIRLSQIQDIAGVRLVVPRIEHQEHVVTRLTEAFDRTAVIDRRTRPSHGYRAVHVIAFVDDVPVELQVRTELQHRWAELSEKMSDVFDPGIKYGGGSESVRARLTAASQVIADNEAIQRRVLALQSRAIEDPSLDTEMRREIEGIRLDNEISTATFADALDAMLNDLRNIAEKPQ